MVIKRFSSWDFPGRPVFKTSPSNARDMGSVPGWGAKISYALWPKKEKENIKQNQYCNKFNKTLKMVQKKKTTKNLLKDFPLLGCITN